MQNEKSRLKTQLDKTIISWQGCQFWNQTFLDEELEKIDVKEIRELFDDDT